MNIKCGHCKGVHENVNGVRVCAAHEEALKQEAAQQVWEEAEAKAEYEAERRAERWWEERWGVEDDPRERYLWALEDQAKEIRERDELRGYEDHDARL